jgi:hypothetical protein
MKAWHTVVGLATLTLFAACQSQDRAASQGSTQAAFTIQTSPAPRGGETRAIVHASASSGSMLTMIGELTYDASRLTLKECAMSPGVGGGASLSTFPPAPGLVRAVVTGGAQPLPQGADLFSCTFTVAADAPSGSMPVTLHGDVADESFQDHTFTAEGTAVVADTAGAN